MAPTFDIGKPQRSLVRIPESGKDKTIKPICLEIAQITSFSKSLSEIMNFDFTSSQEVGGGTAPIPPSLETIPEQRQEHQSVNESTTSTNAGSSAASRKRRSEDEEAQRANKRSAPSPSSLTEENENLDPNQRVEKYQKLQVEKSKLLEQNEELKRKISKFREIMRSRPKLQAFLKTLDEIAC